jgi:hypothetical protein
MEARVANAPTILQIKIRLSGVTKPPVWRRVRVPADLRLDRFHEVIQASMGWLDYHMHVFSADSGEYGIADSELGHRDESKVTLDRLLSEPGDRIIYTYDFGDDWEHEVLLETVLAAEPDTRYPVCVTGKGAGPPEDCGGVGAYVHLREVLADPGAAEHENMLEWLELESASEFDPASCDVEAINESLAYLSTIR